VLFNKGSSHILEVLERTLGILALKMPPKRFFQEPHRRWGSSRNLFSWWGFLEGLICPTETLGFEFERTEGAGT
jgi:hypothetical protein